MLTEPQKLIYFYAQLYHILKPENYANFVFFLELNFAKNISPNIEIVHLFRMTE